MNSKNKKSQFNLNRDCLLVYGANYDTKKYFPSVYDARKFIVDFRNEITGPFKLFDATRHTFDITALLTADNL